MEEIKRLAGELGVPVDHVPRHLRRAQRPADRPVRHVYPKGGTTVAELIAAGSSMGTVALGPTGLRAGRPGPGHQVQGALRDPRPAHRPPGHRPLHRRPAAHRRGDGARVHQHRAGPAGGRHHRHAPVLLPPQGGPGRAIRTNSSPSPSSWWTWTCGPSTSSPARPGKKFEAQIKEITKDVPHPVNVKAAGDMFLLHQWIKNDPVDLLIGNTYVQVHRPGRGHPLDPLRFPHPGPHRPQLLPHRGLPRRPPAPGKDPGRPAGPPGPGRPGGEL